MDRPPIPRTALLVAEDRGRGIRLTAEDVRRLVLLDDAIATAAESTADEHDSEVRRDR